MEKYNRWSDLTTGINPFVPPPHKLPSNVVLRWGQILVGGVVALARWVLLLPLLLLWSLLELIALLLGYIPLIGRLIHRVVDWVCVGLILVVTTMFVKEEDANVRRLGLLPPGFKTPSLRGVAAGDLVVCNHSSVFDVLYLAFRYSPTFVFPCEKESSAKGLVQSCTVFGALRQAMSPPLSSLSSPVKLADVLGRASGPVVVFAEGTRSNGKAVLPFHVDLTALPTSTRIHIVAIRYEYKNIAPTHTCGSALLQLCRVFSHVYHAMKIMHLPAEYVTDASAVRALLASMLRTKAIDVSCADFVSFNKYWQHVNSGGREPASNFTTRKAPHEHAQWKAKDT
ncbi:hypothetical protein SPRG_18350 [Saprolegnia parasitica CBS 223.65]|uniref:Phospholipid/glycerol acyltransferase domain-containing protein n=1 Tax=Saprolegnia parasitica (strain CBS 223.65) TaxID=695850 RepID=A0A067BDD1_SAPPC|nr:hypothetical protein SPRG_18350 [Saprolegnia parasitica CBS 223.65]KDO16113.1 hypothetical protein SPRG_18350 [Saprolegnia parasitica CBS 223.65]|eukprot:XP_012213178.1 hypothetical protein SPRG_18350 [Saprolegnia parasitica CBS 223.65]